MHLPYYIGGLCEKPILGKSRSRLGASVLVGIVDGGERDMMRFRRLICSSAALCRAHDCAVNVDPPACVMDFRKRVIMPAETPIVSASRSMVVILDTAFTTSIRTTP